MARKSRRIVTVIIAALALLGLAHFALPEFAFAQDLEAIGETTGLSTEDPRLIVARIIRAILGLLGIVAVSLIIYAGFLWMTANGESERVDKAKRILINAAIGLVIIFASVAIVQFVIGAILRATGAEQGGGGSGYGDCLGCIGGGSDIGFVVQRLTPSGEVPIRNVVARAYFSRRVDEATLASNVQVFNADSTDEIPVTLAVVGDVVKITPQEACPAPNEDRFCFPENTNIRVQFLEGIRSTGGQDIICTEGVYPCAFTFKTGSIVDTAPPSVSITTPFSGERFNKAFPVPVQAHATDDAMVSGSEFYADDELFSTEFAEGADLTDVYIDTAWDASFYEDDKSYRITAVAYDIADNNAQASLSIRLNPDYCYTEEVGPGEVVPPGGCGGACGACEGSACTQDSDCASGRCVDSVCVLVPTIENISPGGGAVGTYVLISGTNFGSTPGVVFFQGAEGLIAAQIPQCSDGWTNTEILVEVPPGAEDGPIVVRTARSVQDSTSDGNGPTLTDFDVNTVVRPGLCRVSPSTGQPRSYINIYGNGFGAEQGNGFVLFDQEDAIAFSATGPLEYNAWADGEARVRVPALEQADYYVTLTQGGVTSNPVPYYVRFSTDTGANMSPYIQSITPSSGPIGAYVTIAGSNFGRSLDKVWFENKTDRSLRALGSIDFPASCTTEDTWREDQIIVKVPSSYPNGQPVGTSESYSVFVQVGSQISEAKDFDVTPGTPGPSVCAIKPATGAVGNAASLYGERFGTAVGSVVFSTESPAAITRWTPGQIDVTVPAGNSGPVVVRDTTGPRDEEQGVYFTYGQGGEASDVPLLGGYGWTFSTGIIPIVPRIIEACNDTVKSAIPNIKFNDTTCRNVVIAARFSVPMSASSLRLGETVNVYTCSDEDCNPRVGPLNLPADSLAKIGTDAGTTEIRVLPAGPGVDALANTRYRIEIVGGENGVRSAQDVSLPQTFGWEFVTGGDDDYCKVDEVLVQPDAALITIPEGEESFTAGGYARSCLLLSDDFNWQWSYNPSVASLAVGGACDLPNGFDEDSCAVATAVADGVTDITVTEPKSGEQNQAELTVRFADPRVISAWPGCDNACQNAEVGARFNVPVRMSGEGSILAADMVDLYECQSELCVGMVGGPIADIARCTETTTDGQGCIAFKINVDDLKPSTFYRARISRNVQSLAGKNLVGLTTQTHYVWTFSTSNEACAIDSLLLTPGEAVVKQVGARQSFSAVPLSEPDHCSVAGQRLDASAYSWEWGDPIVEEANVATWVKPGGRFFEACRGIAQGCTSNCLPGGSSSYIAVCGNSTLEVGEECDDGNISDNDGCSSVCLIDSESAACGDGSLQRYPLVIGGRQVGFTGEECDDGNNINGDGCSALCFNEGSASVGSVCGNSSIAYEPNVGGEECDDGNSRDGDGCSSVCLNEGSVPLTSQRAVCGDGRIQAPFESCDDDNTVNGDGCSSKCVREGIRAAAYRSICGNGITDRNPVTGAGEDCDGGDGCGSDCLWKGSSLAYGEPSVCGDGIEGPGEYDRCELALGASCQSGSSDQQIAQIAQTAPLQIDAPQESVSATIVVAPKGDEYNNISQEGTFTLSCGARSDLDCSDPNLYSVGVGGCCVLRPEIISAHPSGSTANPACRNALPSFVVTEEVNAESVLSNVRIVKTGGECSQGHTLVIRDEDLRERPLLAFGRRVFQMMIPAIHAQSACIVPIGQVSQVAEGGDYRVSLTTGILFATDSNYEFEILGSESGSDKGLRTTLGGRLLNDYSHSFYVGQEICKVNAVVVEDTNRGDNPPGYFGVSGAPGARTFTATAFSLNKGQPQAIQKTANYTWTWGPWSDDTEESIVSISNEVDGGAIGTALITPTAQSGQATIVASLTVQNETAGAFCASGPSVGQACTSDAKCGSEGACVARPLIVSGTHEVNTFFCENPWPSMTTFPFEDVRPVGGDDEDPNEDGVFAGPGDDAEWTNFSLYYCRDAGDEDDALDDLPALKAIQPPELPSSSGIQKEFLFEVSGADFRGDVIGLRVLANPQYLSPAEWYAAQKFEGSPTALEVDGFEAVRDGRSLYIAGAREEDGKLRSNIYVLSYNQSASVMTQEIFNQLVENFRLFAEKEAGAKLCAANPSRACVSDIDCGAGDVCLDEKGKIARDMQRLTDMNRMARGIESYAVKNGKCSASAMACVTSSDCPPAEQCVAAVPTLAAGTFVPGMTASTWPSWANSLAGAIPSLTADPVNRYSTALGSCSGDDSITCTADADCAAKGAGTCSARCANGASLETCYSEPQRNYVCAENSQVYHFTRDTGTSKSYELSARLEYDGAQWEHDLPQYVLGSIEIVSDADGALPNGFVRSSSICDSGIRGTSSICGDGIVGGEEVCEPGAITTYDSCVLPDGPDIGTAPDAGRIARRCKTTCDGFEAVPGAVCTALKCGNGILEAGEQCDDGVDNGRYGFCSTTCSYTDAPRCGDSIVDPGESCDLGSANGNYAASAANGCAWDCRGPAAYCGDRIVNGSEACDGNVETTTKACANGAACVTNADCADGSTCGVKQACATVRVCVAGAANKLGQPCDDVGGIGQGEQNQTLETHEDSDCDTFTNGQKQGDGQCSAAPVERAKTRSCGAPNGPSACQFTSLGWGACAPVTTCGNGAVESGEECDDGNRENGDSCTNLCRLNICGDRFVFQGVEACDNGSENGRECGAAYGSSCAYCSSACTLISRSGAYCGDGIRQPSTELCDGDDIPYTAVNKDGEAGAACARTSVLDQVGSVNGKPAICAQAGLCNGGTRNGETCLFGGTSLYTADFDPLADCGGGTCQLPKCEAACQTACPFNFNSTTLKFSTQFEGATRETSIVLVKSSDFNPADPNQDGSPSARGTLYIPACRVASAITGDVAFNIDRPDKAYVAFVNDLSGSMQTNGYLAPLKETLGDAISELFTSLDANVKISVMTYGTDIGTINYPNMKSLGGSPASVKDEDEDGVVEGALDSDKDGVNDASDDDINVVGYDPSVKWVDLMSEDGPGYSSGQMTDFYGITQKSRLDTAIDSFRAKYCVNTGVACSEDTDCNPDGSVECRSPGTVPNQGLAHAIYAHDKQKQLAPSENARRIIILMTDGDFSDNYAPSYLACVAKTKGYELYTIRLGVSGEPTINPVTPLPSSGSSQDCSLVNTGTVYQKYSDWAASIGPSQNSTTCKGLLASQTGRVVVGGVEITVPDGDDKNTDPDYVAWSQQQKINHLACLSSGAPDSVHGLNYAYTGSTTESFDAAFKQIINTITGATIKYTVTDAQGIVMRPEGGIKNGNGITIPYPTGFICDPTKEQLIPIEIDFYGTGTVSLRNFQFNYCRP